MSKDETEKPSDCNGSTPVCRYYIGAVTQATARGCKAAVSSMFTLTEPACLGARDMWRFLVLQLTAVPQDLAAMSSPITA
jgi:hypothetical protein